MKDNYLIYMFVLLFGVVTGFIVEERSLILYSSIGMIVCFLLHLFVKKEEQMIVPEYNEIKKWHLKDKIKVRQWLTEMLAKTITKSENDE